MDFSILLRRGRSRQAEVPRQVCAIGSPVLGEIDESRGGDRPALVFCPGEDRLYAPASGKIVRLYPLGNAFALRTDFGMDLYIQVCNSADELLGRYFRPRVLQNEIVSKGKLLLEFDRAKLAAEGAFPKVTLTVGNSDLVRDVFPVAEGVVKPGQDVMQYRSLSGETYRKEIAFE